jgi:Ser/Thr protein kinase RdoA (MazF antagonist)
MPTVEEVSTVLAAWDIDPILTIEAFQTSEYRTSGRVIFIRTRAGQYVLKRMGGDRLLSPELYYVLAATLQEQGVPVAVPLLTRAGTPAVQQGADLYCLFPYLAGEVISEHDGANAEARAWQFGKAIAELHRGLRACDGLIAVPEMDLPGEVAASSQVIRARGGAGADLLKKALVELNRDLVQCYANLPIQLIHRDAHAANLLFCEERVSGWLDFELTRRGPRIFDLCYCATSLLMAAMDDPARRMRWLAVLGQLVQAYSSVNPLTEAERSALWVMLLSIEVIFAGYFIHQKDERGVLQNLDALLWIDQHRTQINGAFRC